MELRHDKGTKHYPVPEAESDECPAAVIDRAPEMRWLADMLGKNHLIKASRATFGGPDSSTWRAWWADAVAMHEYYLRCEEAARNKAEVELMRESRR